MKASAADPRVIEHEVQDPAYWVIFWAGNASDGYRLTGVRSVHEALAWAELNSAGRTFQLFVEAGDGHVVRLLGKDPTRH